MPAAEGLIVVCQCHRSCRYVEVEQLVRYFPQVQFLDKVDDCSLLCSLGFGPDSAACAVLDKVVDLPGAVQRQVYLVGQSRKLWKSRSCNALIRGRCPCCAGRRRGTRGRCHRFSSSPEFVDIPVFIVTVGFQRGCGGDAGMGIFSRSSGLSRS